MVEPSSLPPWWCVFSILFTSFPSFLSSLVLAASYSAPLLSPALDPTSFFSLVHDGLEGPGWMVEEAGSQDTLNWRGTRASLSLACSLLTPADRHGRRMVIVGGLMEGQHMEEFLAWRRQGLCVSYTLRLND